MRKKGLFARILGRPGAREAAGKPDVYAQEMVKGVLSLAESNVREIMVPRIDVVSISLATPVEEIVRVISACGHSRFPVYHETIDNIVGVLYAKDLLRFIGQEEGSLELDKIIRPAYFVPESKKLDSLLREFQRRRVHIAVVVDEYGGTSGVVCLEDVIEEIVGEIQDEFDNETEEIVKIGDDAYLCDARANLEWLNEQLGLELPDADFDTLGGFVFDLFGKIPAKYEKTRYRNIDFIIQAMEGHKINTVKVVIRRPAEAEASP